MNSLEAEAAMPLDEFLQQVLQQLGTDSLEILAGNAPQLRSNSGPQEHAFVNDFNASLPF